MGGYEGKRAQRKPIALHSNLEKSGLREWIVGVIHLRGDALAHAAVCEFLAEIKSKINRRGDAARGNYIAFVDDALVHHLFAIGAQFIESRRVGRRALISQKPRRAEQHRAGT